MPPGYPWATGDALLAADLNAAFANAQSIAGGPFLPLSGGTLNAGLGVNWTRVVSGTAFPQTLYTVTYGSGTSTAPGQPQWNMFLTTDSVHTTAANSIANVANYYTLSGSQGARTAETVSMTINGTADAPGNGNYFTALGVQNYCDGTLGGTSGSYGGQLFGGDITATATGNAKFLNSVQGLEVDVGCETGSSVHYKFGLGVVLWGGDAVESSAHPSSAISIGLNQNSPASKGWGFGLSFGGPLGWWPINPTTGILIYADNPASGGPATTAATGIDFTNVTFSQAAFKSTGFTVAGSGHVSHLSGVDFNSLLAVSSTDLSKHIDLFGGIYGICVQGGRLNYTVNTGSSHVFVVNAVDRLSITGTGMGFNGTAAIAKPTVSGAKGSNAALASLMTALAAYGLVTDSTTA